MIMKQTTSNPQETAPSSPVSAGNLANLHKKNSNIVFIPTPKDDMINGLLNGGYTADEITHVELIIKKLGDTHDPLMRYLAGKLTKEGHGLITKPINADTDWEKLKQDLAWQLNFLIGGDLVHDKIAFAGHKLRKSTRKLSKKKDLDAQDLVRLNRWLIEDVFSVELARRPGRGKNQIQKGATVHRLKKSGKWAVFVTLVKPRMLEGKMRSGRQKFERQTQELAIDLCAEINNQLLNKELARELTQHEVELAKKLFWEILEPKHPDWIEHLDSLVDHAESTDFRIEDKNVPTVEEAVKIFWKEHVSGLEPESKLNYRNAFGFLLPVFGSDKAHRLTDGRILDMAYGHERLQFLKSNVSQGLSEADVEKRLWDTRIESKSKRPWSHDMKCIFLKQVRAFKNWMHSSLEPETQKKRNWCLPSEIMNPDKPNIVPKNGSLPKDEFDKMLDAECAKNPALEIPQVQAIVDVSWVAYDGETAPFYTHGLFCGTRVKETKKTSVSAFNSKDGNLAISEHTAKTDRSRDTETYHNAIVMVEALRSEGLYTRKGLNVSKFKREVIKILAGFNSNHKNALSAASNERRRLAKKGIFFSYNWGIPFPRNALRRTALSMHYKLFLNTATTVAWAGNSSVVFREYYKRLVTKEQAALYWIILPTWLTKKREIKVKLPPGHKLATAMTKGLEAAIANANSAMKSHHKDVAGAIQNSKARKGALKSINKRPHIKT